MRGITKALKEDENSTRDQEIDKNRCYGPGRNEKDTYAENYVFFAKMLRLQQNGLGGFDK